MRKTADLPSALEVRESSGEKLFSPSVARNLAPILEALLPYLPESGRVLEIGAGTGEHGEAICQARSDIIWQPTDIDPISLASQAARARELGGNYLPPFRFDVSRSDERRRVAEFDVLMCANVIHISPWRVAEGLAQLAEEHLSKAGLVFLYGPFLEGDKTASSNIAFDASLKSRNPEWGVRALDDVWRLFSSSGFDLEDRMEMPANNLSLIFRRRAE